MFLFNPEAGNNAIEKIVFDIIKNLTIFDCEVTVFPIMPDKGLGSEEILITHAAEFEIIVVDDLSDSEIEEAVAALDNNKINYIKKQLGSNSSAKNCALDFSKGEYVVFVEESSKLKSNYLELLFNEVSQKNLDIAILTRNGYPSILNETISSGQDYLIEEIKRLKSDLNYNVTRWRGRTTRNPQPTCQLL